MANMVDIDAILTAFLQEVAADLLPGKGIHQELLSTTVQRSRSRMNSKNGESPKRRSSLDFIRQTCGSTQNLRSAKATVYSGISRINGNNLSRFSALGAVSFR
jgi:hypothetical protein